MKTIGLVLIQLFSLTNLAAAETHRFGVVIGNNLGHDPGKELRYAEQDAKKIFKVLTELGGFRPGNLQLLLGASAAEVWDAILKMDQRRQKKVGRTVFMIYYSGHAEGNALELGSSSLEFGELNKFLKSSTADIRLAFIDSCQSGKLVASKGGRRGPAFDIRVNEEIASKGYAVITSSADNELSQESAEIRGSFFTHYLVSALRGAGQTAADGKVTLQEAYRYAYSATVARTSTTVGGSQHPMYDFKLSGRGEIVLTQTKQAQAIVSVHSPFSARLLILDDSAASVVAECEIPASRRVKLALPQGKYQAFLLSEGRVQSSRLDLNSGDDQQLNIGHFEHHSLDLAISKGGLFQKSWTPSLEGGFILRSMPLEGADVSFGAGLCFSLQAPNGWQLLVRLSWTMAPDAGVSTGYFDLSALAGVGYVWPVGTILLNAQIMAGYEHFFQDELNGFRHTSGAAYLANLGIEVPLGNFIIGLHTGIGGRMFRLRDQGWVHRLDLQLFLGLGIKFGE
jgi:hypothetical protein